MTTSTPPGWYPDPAHAGAAPAPERWWDGANWTEHTRGPGGLAPVPPPPMPPPATSSKVPVIAGISAAVVIVAALVVGGVMIAGGSPKSCDESAAASCITPSPPPTPGPTHSRSASPSPPGDGAGGGDEAGKPAQGVMLPVPDGWQRHGRMIGTRPYKCPGETSLTCLRGGASLVVAAQPDATDPKAVAQGDIKWYARTAYDKKAYGGITGHQVVGEGPVEVAGQHGYLVRWKIENSVGPDAYVESVAFPHPDGSGRMLVADISIDIAHGAPSKSVIDDIVSGIQQGDPPQQGSGGDDKAV